MSAGMDDGFPLILSMALTNRSWIAIAICLLTFAESLAVLGTIIPATPMLLLIGTLLGQGTLRPVDVVPWAFFGAVTGYWLSWILGRRLKRSSYARRLLAKRRRSFARVRLLLHRWGGVALVLGRFVLGPLQSMLPLVAGATGMNPRRFHFWNTLSGLIWVPVVLAPGYLVGRGLISFGASQRFMESVTWTLAFVSVAAIIWTLLAFQRGGNGNRRRTQGATRP
jgi:membrane protein DedA with SNARE-associated domain